MRSSRRSVLLAGIATSVAVVSRALHADLIGVRKPAKARILLNENDLRSWIDTLLPEHEDSPSASALDVHLALLEQARGDLQFAQALAQGLRWLDAESNKLSGIPFHETSQGQQDVIVGRAESADPSTVQHTFFRLTLYHSYSHFYSHPDSWVALGYEGPPQPAGFPGFAEAPAGER